VNAPVNFEGRRFPVLMYHRVCERGPRTECYFQRGTAVSPSVFAAQLDWLHMHYETTDLPTAWAWAEGDLTLDSGCTPCVITCDDGYRESLLATAGIPAIYFVPAQVIRDPPKPLWFDRFYALLHNALQEQLPLAPPASLDLQCFPDPCDDLAWWVRGPVKVALRSATSPTTERWLGEMEVFQGSAPDLDELYVSKSQLRDHARRVATIGGHGVTHRRLVDCDDGELARELNASIDVARVAAEAALVFAYPDGSHDSRIARAVGRAGFKFAVTVQPGLVDANSDRLRLPRLLVRDVPPDDPNWPVPLPAVCEGL
jgi:peptidoglycan/xylan/chitin deacetylase (PgdA/CDA1 family)